MFGFVIFISSVLFSDSNRVFEFFYATGGAVKGRALVSKSGLNLRSHTLCIRVDLR
jgi:hypothetical protein